MKKTQQFLVDLSIAVFASGLTAAVCYPLAYAIGYQTVGLIFLIVVAGLSLFIGRSALIIAAILSFAVWNFLFITPLYTFRVHNLHDLIALFANLTVAIVGSAFISRIRKSQLSLKKSQERLTVLYGFLESLNNATSIKDVVKRAREMIKEHIGADVIIYLKAKREDELSPVPFGEDNLHSALLWHHAVEVFAGKEPAFSSFVTSGDQHVILFPLQEPREKIGVIGISLRYDLTAAEDKFTMFKSFVAQIASALDREINIDLAKEKDISTESEKLFRTVLNSVSHELKTPISIIAAAVSNLGDERTSSNPALHKQVITELELASERLSHIVENILDMSRIESGLIRLNIRPFDVGDLIGTLVNGVKKELREHNLQLDIQDDLPPISIDITLLTQALTNVLRNAIIYSPRGSEIRIEASSPFPGVLEIQIADQGPGIPPAALSRLFDKFYRVPGTRPGGTGLGLTIAKAIVEAHNGELIVCNNPHQGTLVRFIFKQSKEIHDAT